MLNLDPAKLLVIFVLALIVVGPDKLPTVARQLARAWKTLTSYREQAEEEIRKVIPNLDLPRIPKNPSVMVSGFLSDLMNPTSASSAVSPQNETQEEQDPVLTSPHGGDSARSKDVEIAVDRAYSSVDLGSGHIGRDDPSMN